ncbi:hypothetical protein ALC62_02967, partial [Cyphomyrmex costatus]
NLGKSHKCGICKKEFKDKSNIRHHERTHKGEKPYQCKLCEYKCVQLVHLNRHLISKHKNDERFKSKKHLYNLGKLYKCGICKKEFKDKTKFHIHERIHKDEKPYQCQFCEYKCV